MKDVGRGGWVVLFVYAIISCLTAYDTTYMFLGSAIPTCYKIFQTVYPTGIRIIDHLFYLEGVHACMYMYIFIGNMCPIPQYSEGIHFGQVYGYSSVSLGKQVLEQHCKNYGTCITLLTEYLDF